MTADASTLTMEKIVSLAKRRGFIFAGSDIYGGLANSWDYGPLGAQMRKNIKDDWWKQVVEMRKDMVGLDGAILMNPKVWEASGHVETFHDPLVECKKCHHRFRADKIADKKLCPDCGGELTTPSQFNLMFQTTIGPKSETSRPVYLRPETAQAIFVNFRNVLESTRKKLPFGIAQIGKAFRNEITPGNFIFRTLEFEQMEIEYFIEEKEWEKHFDAWQKWMLAWAKDIGIDARKIHPLDVPQKDRSHYSRRTVDVEFDFPFGREELWGLAYRTDYDLTQHQKFSGKSLEYSDAEDNAKKFLPHVIEPSMGVDRTLLAILVSAYHEETVNNETRVVMKFTPSMAPYQVVVLPLSKKVELCKPADAIYTTLLQDFRTEYDVTQSIGKRYRRQDEIGTPYCVTVDFDTLNDNAVTVRDRDTMKQDRVAIAELTAYLKDKLHD